MSKSTHQRHSSPETIDQLRTSLSALMIDNYDSFTYNLVQYFLQLGVEVTTRRNDQITVEEVIKLGSDFIIISPGPSKPNNAGICVDLVAKCIDLDIPVLGVCLGHQTIAQVLGGSIIKSPHPAHGKVARLQHTNQGVFKGIEQGAVVTRYHSLMVERFSLPKCLSITAETEEGLIMGVRHKTLLLEGVQFHPESILTKSGLKMLDNFCDAVEERKNEKRETAKTNPSKPNLLL